MSLRARIAWLATCLIGSWALTAGAAAQSCPSGRYCFYVPPGLPLEGSHSTVSSRVFDIVISSPVRTVTGTYTIGSGTPTSFSVSPGDSARVVLGANGPASAYNTPERRGVFIVAESPDLTVDHRETFDQEQYSETIKRGEIALGTRFRLGGYSLNREGRPLAAVDVVLVYAPTGGTIALRAPPGATLPFWNGSATAEYDLTLAEGQTVAVRTVVGRDFDGALLTATAPVAVSSGGRGWSVAGGCGDDGMDGLVPVTALGSEYVVRLPTGSYPNNNESRVRVIADVDGTEVRVNGTLVATLAAGAFYNFAPTDLSYVQTSRPALVWMNGSIDGCEVDTVLIPPIAFAPALTELSLDFNVPASMEVPAGEFAILIATAEVPSIRLDGVAPTFISNEVVPLRPDLTYARFNVTPGDRNVRARRDFQAMLASRTEPSGLLAYYNPYRIPGCGDGAVDPGEACDDGDLDDGDGCSSNCQVEPGYACSGAPSMCATTCGNGAVTPPNESCDDGNVTPGDGCNVTCRREIVLTTPMEGSVGRAAMPVVSGSADPGASVLISIGDVMTTVVADGAGAFAYTVPTVLADGSYTVRATATDVRGGTSSAMRTLRIDTSTTVTISAPAADAVVETATPTVVGTGEAGATVDVSIDGTPVGSTTVGADGSWSFTLTTPLVGPTHRIDATARDALGNSANAGPINFSLDVSTTVSIAEPTDGSVLDTATPVLRGTGEPGAIVSITIDGRPVGTVQVDAQGAFRARVPTPLSDGLHRAEVESRDARGNRASSSVSFTVQTVRDPLLLILNLPDGAFTRDPQPPFSGVADPGAHVSISFDGVQVGTVTSSARGSWSLTLITPLTPGSHVLEASTTNAQGRSATDRHTFTFEAASAALTLAEPAAGSVTSDATPPIVGTSTPGARVMLAIDEMPVGESTAGSDGRFMFEPTTPLSDGRHAVRATANDGSANVATVEVGFYVDTRTYVEILRPSGTAGGTRPTIVGLGEPGTIVTLSIDGMPIGEVDVAGDGTFQFAPLSPLDVGAHVVRAQIVDQLGNRAEDTQAFVIDVVSPDSDGDGLPDGDECGGTAPCRDSDGDGLPDAQDPDDDGDGLPTARECAELPCPDSDGDARPDHLDGDDDGDGRPTADERSTTGEPRDSDRDGRADHLDPDDDGDGLPTSVECASVPCRDSDGDAAPDYLDPDDDNDRVPTARERTDGMRIGSDEVDGDGRVHWLDPDANGNGLQDDVDGTGDSDGDGTPDYLDLDSERPDPIDPASGFGVAGGGGCNVAGGGRGADGLPWFAIVLGWLVRRRVRSGAPYA
jgi:cysteine-rich repeat protein